MKAKAPHGVRREPLFVIVGSTALLALTAAAAANAQDAAPSPNPSIELYGHAQTDMGFDFGSIDPQWFDVERPTKLPSSSREFGANGNWFFGVRQSRFGIKTALDTPAGELQTKFEFELFGVAENAGQTTFRLRHFYGELGAFLAGQTWSLFMDPDVFPNSLEYWGPNGMVFYRNVQVRWTPIRGDATLAISLERPGSSADLGSFQESVALEDVKARFPVPDVAAQLRYGGDWGHVQAAGIVRYIHWDDLGMMAVDLSGHTVGWGVNLSSNIKFGEGNIIKLQGVYGRGIQNYMNDGGADIGVEVNPAGSAVPVRGVPLPILGVLGFIDVQWSRLMSSTAGYSLVLVDNSTGQTPSAFKRGQYALANLLFYPVDQWMLGPEFQWGQRKNFSDGWQFDDFRIQFSVKYKFSFKYPK